MMADVRVQNLKKSFETKHGRTEALKDMSLQVNDGEFVVLVGPSGCGKTTTLRIIAGLEFANEGDVYIGNRQVTRMHPSVRRVAMVFQEYALYPHMNVEQNMSFGLRNLKVPKAEIDERLSRVSGMLGISNLMKRLPRELSGGQRQRVALGRAIVRSPDVFLFDEPLSNLDARLRVQMRFELAELHQQLGTTSIYVTHDQAEAMTLGDRIVVMNEGVVQQVGKPHEIYHLPENLFVAGFVGIPPMNLLPGRLLSENGLCFQSDSGIWPLPGLQAQNLSPWLGKEVTLGIRPEDILVSAFDSHSTSEGPSFVATVSVAESIGSEYLLYFRQKSAVVVARADETGRRQPGDRVHCHLRNDRIYLFDSSTGKRIGSTYQLS